MGILGQVRRAAMVATGFSQVIAQRDLYCAEREAAYVKLHELVSERDFLRAQLAKTKAEVEDITNPIHNLIDEIHSSIEAPSMAFFHFVDRARRTFIGRQPNLADALLAVKLINLLIAKHEYQRGSIITTARPVGFMLDPANQCHLGCPSCTNTYNREYSEAFFNQWPRGLMTETTFDKFISEGGLYAFSGHLYNNHEPLLNKLTPSFVKKATDLRVRTFISSNLSFRKIDAEAIVASGLSELMVAADGVTQPVYERYRKGGNIEWVLNNARAIVEAKKKLNSKTPVMRWQFLTFEHNLHEVPEAIKLAREIGFDTFNLATPNAVESDDPTVHAVEYPGPEQHKSMMLKPRIPLEFHGDLEPHRKRITDALNEGAVDRWQKETCGIEQPKDKTGHRCDWLNLSVISDANGRIIACCNADYKALGRLSFANIHTSNGNLMGSADYRMARKIMVDPEGAAADNAGLPITKQVVCAKCPARPLPQAGLGAVGAYVAETPSINQACYAFLHDWSRHTPWS